MIIKKITHLLKVKKFEPKSFHPKRARVPIQWRRSELTNGQGPNWPYTKVLTDHRSELTIYKSLNWPDTKVQFDHTQRSELTIHKAPNWPYTKVRIDHTQRSELTTDRRSELTKAWIVQGPNWPKTRSKLTKVWIDHNLYSRIFQTRMVGLGLHILLR